MVICQQFLSVWLQIVPKRGEEERRGKRERREVTFEFRIWSLFHSLPLSFSLSLPLSFSLSLSLSFSLSHSPLLSFILFLPFLFISVPILLCLWPAPHSLIPSPSTLPRLSAPPSCAAAVYYQAMEAAARMLRGPRATGEDDADAERPLSLGPLSRPSSTARCISPLSSLLYSLSLSLLLSGSAHSRGSFLSSFLLLSRPLSALLMKRKALLKAP